MRLAIVASHPVQYYAPLFRTLASQLELTVFYAHKDTEDDQARAGFGKGFAWDVDLLSGYCHHFLSNEARHPGLGRFGGVDTPDVEAALLSKSFDGVLLMGWYLKTFLQALYAAKRNGLPVLVRGDSQLDTPRSSIKLVAKELFYPPFLRLFDAALVVGHRNRAYWRHYKYPSSRMFDSPHCVDTEWFAKRASQEARLAIRERCGIASESPVALFAGKLVDFKRPYDLLKAAAKVRASGLDLHVLVAGSGTLESDIRSSAVALGVPLHMLGFCNQTEMPGVYAACDVLVLPSTGRETWGLVVNEAVACGRRVIVSDEVGCAPDMSVDPSVVRSYAMGDIDSLTACLTSILLTRPNQSSIKAVSEAHSLDVAAAGITSALRIVRRPDQSSGT